MINPNNNKTVLYKRNSSVSFTGKERDEETGYSYFGARYYDSDLSGLFLSVDPMADKYPSISPYAYCAWNPVKLMDPDGEDPVFLGLLEYHGKAKYGNSHLGETQKIGNFHVVPFYDNNNNLIGYNAGRYRSNGSYVTEYQMEPGDLKVFSQKHKLYEAAANLVYCAGEPDWSSVAFVTQIFSNNYSDAFAELGKMWGDALKKPEFCIDAAVSVASIGLRLPTAKSANIPSSKAIRSLEKRCIEHQEKLSKYLSNPLSGDNKGILNGASYSRFKNIFNGRVEHLLNEINTFKKNIENAKSHD